MPLRLLVTWLTIALPCFAIAAPPTSSTDVALAWNQIMLDANAIDSMQLIQDQGGPTRTARAFAIVSLAMFDAWNSVHHVYYQHLTELRGYENASDKAAVATAAHVTLVSLFPQQQARFDMHHREWLGLINNTTQREQGVKLGRLVANAILDRRRNDNSDLRMDYPYRTQPGYHQPDPLHPNQGFHAPLWGYVNTFKIGNAELYLSPPPPALGSRKYADAYFEVMALGGDGVSTPTLRTPEQTITGIFWAYDGTPGLGAPPRLYNQIVRVIAVDKRNTVGQNLRLFGLVNLAMADAAIQCWYTKYRYEFWRPVVAIRNGERDGNPLTLGDPGWRPLGAPATNGAGDGVNFTPPFPAYSSGHAIFGAASLWTVARFYGTPRLPFRFTSDEFNGINRNGDGSSRPVVTRSYSNLNDAILENAYSRIYLGIHWSFDATVGVTSGKEIANIVFDCSMSPRVVGRQ
jgi:membrane-associated phospholipid phosphatase